MKIGFEERILLLDKKDKLLERGLELSMQTAQVEREINLIDKVLLTAQKEAAK
jgi:hypothetical protein